MASSKVMSSRSPPNADHPRQPSPSRLNLHSDQTPGFGSMNIDDILRNIYTDSETIVLENSTSLEGGNGESSMTLEDYLAKAGAVNEEVVRVSATIATPPPPTGAFEMEAAKMTPATGVPFAPAMCVQDGMTTGGFGVDFSNEIETVSGSFSGCGRGKRKGAVEQLPLDKVTQQKQRRMIKNRESAARSRERKHAYTVELEALVTQLEEDNARLMIEEAELNKERYKQLMENLIPVIEKRRPPRVIRRVHSMEW